jgi:hypothetical protein
MLSRLSQVRWKRSHEVTRTFALREVGAPTSHFAQLLQRTGIPDLQGTPRDKAVQLLQMASEVEHTFVVQYLYGAFSLVRNDPGAKWNGVLFNIAKEEMGHLATVQNLLALLGELPHLDRQSFPAPPSYPFEKVLKVFALDWLGDFVIAESPKDAMLPPGLPPAPDMEKVGTIYLNLYWLFKESEAPGGPWPEPNPGFAPDEHLSASDFAEPQPLTDWLMTADDWGQDPELPGQPMAGFRILAHGPFNTRDEARMGALAAIFDVAAQGEGPIPQTNSHFERLSRLYTAARGVATLPRKNIPDNPHTKREGTGDPEAESGLITHSIAVKLATLINLRYGMLLTEIGHIARTPRTRLVNGEIVRVTLTGWAISQEMHFVNQLSDQLNIQPLKASKTTPSDLRASAPFELPAAIPSTDHARWQSYIDVMDQTGTLVNDIGAAATSLSSITNADEARRPFIVARLAEP